MSILETRQPVDLASRNQTTSTLAGEDIVCFAGEDWWFHNPHSNLHLMKIWSQNNRVLFVNSIGIKMPDLKGDAFAWRRVAKKLASLLRYLRRAQPNLFVMTPFALPLFRRHAALVGRINTWLLRAQILAVMALLRFRKPIFWVTVPVVCDAVIAMRWRSRGLVYYCVDNVSAFPGVDQPMMLALEQTLHRKADAAFFVNRTLCEERKALNPRTYLLTHGVDFEHFATAQAGRLPAPADLADITGPIVGYMGEIRGLDTDLIRFLAQKNPDLTFVFIGDVYQDLSACLLLNVRVLGRKSYAELPAYLQRFACCCLYYRTDDTFNRYRNPKKLLEYLATGKPVVSVDIPEVRHVQPHVRIGNTPEQFQFELHQVLSSDDPSEHQARIAYAQSHSWEGVAARASEHILEAIGPLK